MANIILLMTVWLIALGPDTISDIEIGKEDVYCFSLINFTHFYFDILVTDF